MGDLHNVIEDQRYFRLRTPFPPRWSLVEDVAPVGKSGFRALVGPLRQVRWPDKLKTGKIDRYGGSSNLEEFIQVYQAVIEAAGGDDRVKDNFLPTTLTGVARSWLINLLEGSITSWDQLCVMFIRNFQGMYERPSTTVTLKTIRQKHDESLWDHVKCFCNARNTVPYIQDIEIINTFHDGVSDIKTVEENAMKKLKTVADLLAVVDVCIEASEAQAQLLESWVKGGSRKKEDPEVNTADRGDRKDQGDHGYHGKKSSKQKEKMSFRHLDDEEKWCEIHCTVGHDLKEYKTFLDRKKIPPAATSTPQEPQRVDHCRVDSDGYE
jgi:hypothetical protein